MAVWQVGLWYGPGPLDLRGFARCLGGMPLLTISFFRIVGRGAPRLQSGVVDGSVRGFCACPGNELQKRSAIGRFFRWIGAFSDQKNALS